MLDTKDRPSECVKCKRYQKQIERLKKAIIKTDVESVRQSMQHEDEISDLNDKYSYTYEQFQNAKAQIKQLKAEQFRKSKQEKGIRKGW